MRNVTSWSLYFAIFWQILKLKFFKNGLGFVPVQTKFNYQEQRRDFENFGQRMR